VEPETRSKGSRWCSWCCHWIHCSGGSGWWGWKEHSFATHVGGEGAKGVIGRWMDTVIRASVLKFPTPNGKDGSLIEGQATKEGYLQ